MPHQTSDLGSPWNARTVKDSSSVRHRGLADRSQRFECYLRRSNHPDAPATSRSMAGTSPSSGQPARILMCGSCRFDADTNARPSQSAWSPLPACKACSTVRAIPGEPHRRTPDRRLDSIPLMKSRASAPIDSQTIRVVPACPADRTTSRRCCWDVYPSHHAAVTLNRTLLWSSSQDKLVVGTKPLGPCGLSGGDRFGCQTATK